MIDFKVVLTPPKVFLVGVSTPTLSGMERYLAHRGSTWNSQDDPIHPEALVEIAGRVCYASWENPAGRTRTEYIQNMFEHGHGSTTEHVWLNFMVADLPRSSQMELVRHGDGTAFSFESTRFTDKNLRFIVPPSLRRGAEDLSFFEHECRAMVDEYAERVERLTKYYRDLYPDDKTLARKRAKEGARSGLPNSQGSDGLFSTNIRGLRWILQVRSDEHADQSIREFAHAVYEEALPWLPASFADATLNAVREGTPEVVFKHRKV